MLIACVAGSAAVAQINPSADVSAQEKPNIVLVFMDNFGWGEPGFNGGGIVRGAATPSLDQSQTRDCASRTSTLRCNARLRDRP